MNEVIKNPKYSVLMSVYAGDNPEWLREAIDSMLAQTIKPSEFVIVKDGILGYELDEVIDGYVNLEPNICKAIQLPSNVGVGQAKKTGVENCNNEFIAIMDADDISLPTRIQRELEIFAQSSDVDVVGCFTVEFINTIDNVVSRIFLPETHYEIARYAKKRIPVRHSSLLMRRDAILETGNYENYRTGEDYNLIVKMIIYGKKLYNIPEVLHYMRVNDDFYHRRGGIKNLRNVYNIKIDFIKIGFITRIEFLISFIPHVIVALVPGFIRELIYRKLLRY